MKHYTELSLECHNAEMAEIATAFLADFPFESFDSESLGEHTLLRCYIDAECWEECREEALRVVADYGKVVSQKRIESENWNARWEAESFHPVSFEADNRRVVIRAPHHAVECDSSTIDVIVSPQMSFGSGHHHTTRLMCRNILSLPKLGKALDVGCGTGVLSIVALRSVAESVDAVDIDPWSTTSAEEAVRLNGLEGRMSVILGTVEAIDGRCYDLVMANINRNIILSDLGRYAAALRSGGYLIISGFLTQDIECIVEATQNFGFETLATIEEEGWVSLKLRKN